MTRLATIANHPNSLHLANLQAGHAALLLAQLCARKRAPTILYIAETHAQATSMMAHLKFFMPANDAVYFPPWDCLPYEPRNPDISLQAQRMAILARLHTVPPQVLCTTIAATMQRLVPRQYIQSHHLHLHCNNTKRGDVLAFLSQTGYRRVGLVTSQGDYAVRGGLIDMFPSQAQYPLRLDFFGDSLQTIRGFDPETQRNQPDASYQNWQLTPSTELPWHATARAQIQTRYRRYFGLTSRHAPIASQLTQCTPPDGLAPYQPLLFASLDSLWAHYKSTLVFMTQDAMAQARAYTQQIAKNYKARQQQAHRHEANPPLPPKALYLSYKAWQQALTALRLRIIHSFQAPQPNQDCGGRAPPDFALPRKQKQNVFAAVAQHIRSARAQKQRVLLTAPSHMAAMRLRDMMGPHDCDGQMVKSYSQLQQLALGQFGIAVLESPQGFCTDEFLLISQADILGQQTRPARQPQPTPKMLQQLSSHFKIGDYVVHRDHGIGQFEGLHCLNVAGAPHECLKLRYRDSAILYVPVEHSDIVFAYGHAPSAVPLDSLGRAAWSKRRARIKQRLLDMAQQLVKVAAVRSQQQLAPSPKPSDGSYDMFCHGFAYEPTPDQQAAINTVEHDLAQTKPMDRLICGDAGYGKTEVALRAAFLVSWAGGQVAILAPTSLLVRQHVENFRQRFRKFPVEIGELSGLQSPSMMAKQRTRLANGSLNIIIGTHSLLSRHVQFKDLRLVIIDEEQHFGVRHKEALKALRQAAHVLALSATPIPRSLQLALGGVKDLSLIRQAPPGRLEVSTHIAPFDPLTLRDGLLREKHRQGQSFFICPRVHDLPAREDFLRRYVPDLSFVTAHGQLPPRLLEARIAQFYAGACDVLLSTSIVESGLDIPSANTIIIDEAQKFGLGQLYQMRGRVGRAQQRAFAYLCYPPKKTLTPAAKARLRVLQQTKGAGASFALAIQDLEFRGGGNLLGTEQSGHIKEVGFALYQQMLDHAIRELQGSPAQVEFTPKIQLKCPALLPDVYIPDFDVRLQEYRRLAAIDRLQDAQALQDELGERFGPLPAEARNLFVIVKLKCLCQDIGIAKLSATTQGIQLEFHQEKFANPDDVLQLLQNRPDLHLRGNFAIQFSVALPSAQIRLKKAQEIVQTIYDVTSKSPTSAAKT